MVDPLVMNLAVAKGIPCFADLDIGQYVRLADQWASDIRQPAPGAEVHFRRSPADWKNDIRFFRLGIVCLVCRRGAGHHLSRRACGGRRPAATPIPATCFSTG